MAVRALGNKRGVVVAVGRKGRYQVRVENITMWCGEGELIVAAEPRRKSDLDRPHNRDGPRRHGDTETAKETPPCRIDLHGLVVEDALARVIEAINQAILRGADRLEVVHGKGTGRIRAALHRQLASMPGVTLRLDPRNDGVTWIHFQ